MTVGTPMVRTEAGTIIGPDYRRIPGFARSQTNVPGVVAASVVERGDTVRLAGQDVVVITKREHGSPGVVYIGTRTVHGAEIVHEFRTTERVRVIGVGAFDR